VLQAVSSRIVLIYKNSFFILSLMFSAEHVER
jgi:hypothetical protein